MRILVATDFSPRSDRAIRRAVLLAKTFGAHLTLLNVVDNDLPPRRIRAERHSAALLLGRTVDTLRAVDGIDSDSVVSVDSPFQGILKACRQLDPDLLVIGAHRRQSLMDMFVGTTAERLIRVSPRPVLMANAVPAAPYRHVLIAVDFSPFSAEAVRAAARLGLQRQAAVSVLHVYDPPAAGLLLQASLSDEAITDLRAEAEERAAAELAAFLRELEFAPLRRIVRAAETLVADTIREVAAELSADVIVVGTRGRTGSQKLLLGSVTEDLFRSTDCDVIAVPPPAQPGR
jgi:nucleotide-binding universal stress UspA family protein